MWILYTLWVVGGASCLPSELTWSTSNWKYSSKILVHIDMITQLLQICQLQMSCTELRSGDFGVHLNTVNSWSCSINHFFNFLKLCIILLDMAIGRWVRYDHTGMNIVSNNKHVACGIQTMQLVLRYSTCAKEISNTPLNPNQQGPFLQARVETCFHKVYAKLWACFLNVAEEIETRQTR